MRLVFMGTPDFAVPSLKRLAGSRHGIAGVVTVPDKPAGRGRALRASAVKRVALDLHLPVLQPENLKEAEFLSALREWKADCYVVVAFRILPPEVFGIPQYGAVNLHTSLLPKYRGAAPIQWALMNGETETGVTTFLIDKNVDTGNILMQKRVPILPDEDAECLHDKLADQGADLLVETMNRLEEGTLAPRPQQGGTTPAPKIRPEHTRIDWSEDCETLRNKVRALSPAPGAFAIWQGGRIKLFRAECVDPDRRPEKPGVVLRTGDEGIDVQCGTGVLRISELQLEGKKRMRAADFLRGNRIGPGDRLIPP